MQEHPENIQNQNREPKSWRAEFWERKLSKLWMKKLRFLLSTLKLARSTLRSCAGRRNVEKILFYSFVAELLLTAEVFWVSVQWIIYTNWSIYHSWLWSNSSVNRDQLLLFYNIHIKAAFGRELLFYTTRQSNSRAVRHTRTYIFFGYNDDHRQLNTARAPTHDLLAVGLMQTSNMFSPEYEKRLLKHCSPMVRELFPAAESSSPSDRFIPCRWEFIDEF